MGEKILSHRKAEEIPHRAAAKALVGPRGKFLPDTSELHGNWEQTVTGIWRFK